ncbi:uncharacterized protein LOC103947114 [Pyrus x bretschneideri]|uniref:uncharacterized protein LOC103947114 n=1 Tax=Pyrus x bretschneideri TaxID=225117 RepID=UPI00202DEF49|nr:uncharacterized protein LOC103947114 [Pyrus x bretschneideri]
MVYIGGAEEEERVAAKSMAMGSERTKALHNFNLPWDLKWGNQKHLRCQKESSDAGGSGGEGSGANRRSSAQRMESSPAVMTRRRDLEFQKRKFRAPRPRIENDDAEEGIDAFRQKLMFDLKTAADKMKDAILREEEVAVAGAAADTDVAAADEDVEMAEVGESEPPVAPEPEPPEARPWNLRTRRAACKAPMGGGGGGAKVVRIEEKKANYSPLRSEGNNGVKSPRLVRGASVSGPEKNKEEEKPKFSLTLTKKEIEEDFMKMLGHRPPRRPKRRPRNAQKQLDGLFPGAWLTEVSAETYKVPEFPENTKR